MGAAPLSFGKHLFGGQRERGEEKITWAQGPAQESGFEAGLTLNRKKMERESLSLPP